MHYLTRCPFTIILVILLVAAGIYGRAHVGPLDGELQRQAGHSAQLLWRGEWYRLLTSILFTVGGLRFYISLAMLAVAVGWLEFARGTPVAAMTFVGVHIATLLIMACGIALSTTLIETHRGNLLWYVKDVGPSAGYYGCLGLAVASLAPGIRLPIVITIFLVLVGRSGWSTYHLPENGQMMSADIAHLIAFPLGLFISRF